ncbi:eukaryotic translation initiation factor 2-alpha kinase [Procambarus clarkii]|uniref:eukaryotic translation initiation factor 2-alpha kinase n=1 Tax=Procambarus clarkii TaxID=6728 RepID=UPI0037435B3B
MSHWHRCTIRLLLGIIVVCLLLVSYVVAEGDDRSDPRQRLSFGKQDCDDERLSRHDDPHAQESHAGGSRQAHATVNTRPGQVQATVNTRPGQAQATVNTRPGQAQATANPKPGQVQAQGTLGWAEDDASLDYQEDEGSSLVVEDEYDDDDLDLEAVHLESEKYENVYGRLDFDELPNCQQEEERRPAVVVSTLDGRVTSMDLVTGAVLWSYQTGGTSKPLLSSSMSKLEVTSRGEWVRLIPSLDGGIFRFDGEGVEALPVTADTLLHSSFKFNAETIFTGGRDSEVWGIAAGSGQIAYICNSFGCKRRRTASNPTQVLIVRRVTQTVRAVDPKSGDERWNFSVGQHEVNLAGGGCDSMTTRHAHDVFLPNLHFVVPDGVIMGMDDEGRLIWQEKLASPVVNAWRILDGELEPVDLFSTSTVPALNPNTDYSGAQHEIKNEEPQPAMYVGVHQKQLYIQQSGVMRHKVNSAARIFTADSSTPDLEMKFPRVQWRPYLASAPSRTPIVHYSGNKYPLLLGYNIREEPSTAVAVAHPVDYPFDNGYYLYADESTSQLNLSRPWENPDDIPAEEEDTIMDDVAAQIMLICFHLGPDTWLKIGVGLACYAVVHYLMLQYIMLHMKRHLTRQAIALVNQMLPLIVQNNAHVLALMQRMGIQLPALPAPPEVPAVTANAPVLLNSSELSLEEKSEPPSPEYTSRYLTDFELVQCLGRGGFGVVFQVRNKLDENEYAVKRITLPSKESSAERVKREVRALAKLNHINIVRYYNSWLESPPPGWQDEMDVHWKNSDVVSSPLFTPGTEESHNLMMVPTAASKMAGGSPGGIDYHSDESGSYSGNRGDEKSAEDDELFQVVLHDDSFDVVFENSCNTSKTTENMDCGYDVQMSYDVFESSSRENQVERNRRKKKNNRNNDFSVSNNVSVNISSEIQEPLENSISNSIVFEDSGCESRLNVSHSKSEECSITQPKVTNKQRVESQSVQNNISDSGGRLKLKDEIKCQYPRSFLYIQMELCQKESLKDWLLQNQKREQQTILTMFNDIICAVEYVHDNQLMHRDLKPSNIFFSLNGEVKIGDFGLVTTITKDEQEDRTPSDAHPLLLPSSRNHTHRVGTQLYMSPEQVTGQVYDYKVDIYSLGLIFFEMLVPFSTGMERLVVMSHLRDGEFPKGFENQFPDESSLLKLMLSNDPASRPTTRGIRARNPLRPLQGQAINDILPEDHFRLSRQRSHARSSSGSFSFSSTSSS